MLRAKKSPPHPTEDGRPLPQGRGEEGRAARPWLQRLTLAAFTLFVLACAGAIQLNSTITGIAATLPPTPDIATLPVSVAVTDRDGSLLRPFTTKDGRWRLPIDRAAVDPRFLAMLIAYEDRSFATMAALPGPPCFVRLANSSGQGAASSPAVRRSPCRSPA